MARLTKKQKEALAKIEKGKIYSVDGKRCGFFTTRYW